jgi:hypothetical protein
MSKLRVGDAQPENEQANSRGIFIVSLFFVGGNIERTKVI